MLIHQPAFTPRRTARVLGQHFAALTQVGFDEQQALAITGYALSDRIDRRESLRRPPVGEYLAKLVSLGLLRARDFANGSAVS